MFISKFKSNRDAEPGEPYNEKSYKPNRSLGLAPILSFSPFREGKEMKQRLTIQNFERNEAPWKNTLT